MSSPKAQSVKVAAAFPPGFFLENIVSLPDDTLLVSVANRHALYALPPPLAPDQARIPFLIHTYADDQWAFGMTQMPSDPRRVFALSTDFTSTGSKTHFLYFLDFATVVQAGHPKQIVQFPPETRSLNGLCALSDTVLIAADSFAGVIWRIDVEYGQPAFAGASPPAVGGTVSKWLADPLFEGTLILPDFQPGVNGLKYSVKAHAVGFTSTQQKVFGTVGVEPVTLDAVPDSVTVLAHGMQADDLIIDDEFDAGPVAYITTHRDNSILRVALDPKTNEAPVLDVKNATQFRSMLVAEGNMADPVLLGPSAGAFKVGAGGRSAFFTCDGGLKHQLEDGVCRYARIVEVDF